MKKCIKCENAESLPSRTMCIVCSRLEQHDKAIEGIVNTLDELLALVKEFGGK